MRDARGKFDEVGERRILKMHAGGMYAQFCSKLLIVDGGCYVCLEARPLGETLRPHLPKSTSTLSSQAAFQLTAPQRSVEGSGGFPRVIIFPRHDSAAKFKSDATRGQTTVSVALTEPSTPHGSEMKCSSRGAQHRLGGSEVRRRSGRPHKAYTTSPVRSSRDSVPVQPNARSHLGMHGARHDIGAAGVG